VRERERERERHLDSHESRVPDNQSLLGGVIREREFFIDNLQVRIHLIIEMISVDRPRAMGV
jgi:hypothetical protein